MKLSELFSDNPVSFLDEMVDNTFIGDQPLDKQDISFDVAYSRPVGTFNGLEIWGSKYFGKKYDLYGILNKERDILSWLLFDSEVNPGYSTFIRAWTLPTERGKNHTLTIINFLITKGKEKVILDKNEVTSSSSRGILIKWFNMSPQYRHFSMSFHDKTGKIESPDISKILEPGSRK